MNTVSLGICQVKQGYDLEDNISRALLMVDRVARQGADVAVLPEMFYTPYEPVSIRSSARFSEDVMKRLAECSIRNNIMIVAGSIPWVADGKRFFNRSYVFDRHGDVIFSHDKIHLFDCSPPGGPEVTESENIMPGDSLGTFETPWGNASAIVCYDIRFSPLAQILSDKDLKILFVPAAFSLSTGPAHWEMLVRSRAVEMQCFVAGVQPARNHSLKYIPYGHSLVVSPWGDILFDAGEKEAHAVVKIDLDMVADIREKFPLLRHRRKDLYETSWRRKP